MEPKEIEIIKVFKMFANENQLLEGDNIKLTLKCLGFVLKNTFDVPETQLTFNDFKTLVTQLSFHPDIYNKENIDDAFKILDTENTGYVKAKDLRDLLLLEDGSMTESEINDFFVLFPPNAKGEISYKVLLEKLYNDN